MGHSRAGFEQVALKVGEPHKGTWYLAELENGAEKAGARDKPLGLAQGALRRQLREDHLFPGQRPVSEVKTVFDARPRSGNQLRSSPFPCGLLVVSLVLERRPTEASRRPVPYQDDVVWLRGAQVCRVRALDLFLSPQGVSWVQGVQCVAGFPCSRRWCCGPCLLPSRACHTAFCCCLGSRALCATSMQLPPTGGLFPCLWCFGGGCSSPLVCLVSSMHSGSRA